MLCVQSMDGALAIFTQERFAFERFLPNFLVPGPLCYLPATDTFVTCNAACIVEAYKYMVLASATARDERADDDDDASADDKSGSGKKVQVCVLQPRFAGGTLLSFFLTPSSNIHRRTGHSISASMPSR